MNKMVSLSFFFVSPVCFVSLLNVQSRAINVGRQGHSLTQSKMLHCKTVVNIISCHHVV
jgi:hypothetical protein